MTIDSAFASAREQRQGNFDDRVLRDMLSELDGRIYYEIIEPYGIEGEFSGYTDTTPGDTELLAPFPYDSLYTAYLVMGIDQRNHELAKYNNSSIRFNTLYNDFKKWWARTHSVATPSITFRTRRL